MRLIVLIKIHYVGTSIHHERPQYSGADPGFQARGGAFKKLRRAEGGAKIVEVFRVKNHYFTPKNHISSNCGGRRTKYLGYFV